MYNDLRARDQATRVAEIAPPDAPVHGASASLAKLIWLVEHCECSAGQRAIHQAEWILAKLAARNVPGDENNCLKLGYDAVSRDWPSWLAKLGLPDSLFPSVVPAGQDIGTINPAIAEELGLPDSCRLIAGTTDSTAAVLASGISEPGEAATSLGSTLVLKVLSEQPITSPVDGVYSHRILGNWLVGGASNSGGAVLKQFFDDEEMLVLTPMLKPDTSTGLDYYPLPAIGERFPHNDPDIAPRIEPIPEDRALFFLGLLEGIARIEQQGYQKLSELGAPQISRVVTMGGGAKNKAWEALRANLMGVPVASADQPEAAYGTALLAHTGVHQRD